MSSSKIDSPPNEINRPTIIFPKSILKIPPALNVNMVPDELYNGPQLGSQRGSSSKKSSTIFSFVKRASRFFVGQISAFGGPILNQNDTDLLKNKLNSMMLAQSAKKRSSKVVPRTSTSSAKHSRGASFFKTSVPNYLWIIFFVKKFVNILKANVLIKKLIKLKPYHYELIADNTYFESSYTYLYNMIRFNNPLFKETIPSCTAKFLKFKEKISYPIQSFINYSRKIQIFQPDKTLLLCWNFIMLVFVVMNVIYIPLKLGFDLDESKFNVYLTNLVGSVPVWIFVFDIILNLNTAYYSKGVYIMERQKILSNYIKSTFFLDIITILPFMIAYFTEIPYIETLFMLRLFKLKKSIKKLEDFLQVRDLNGGIFELIKLAGTIFYIAHISCCGWHYLGLYEIQIGEVYTWMDPISIRYDDWTVRYVNSLYYSIVTMVTVGYGDIGPVNTLEKIYCIGSIVIACGVFAYSVNEIGTILKEMYKHENEFKTRIIQINSYMKQRGLNKVLQMRVQKYLEYMYEENKYGYKNGEFILSHLSNTLKQEVLIDIYGKILRDNKIFPKIFSFEFLNKVSLKMKEMTYAPDDIIMEESAKHENNIYFIIKGEVELFQNFKKENLTSAQQFKSYKILKRGDQFGSFSFFSDKPREISAKSINVTHVACLEQRDFLEILKEFPEDFQKYRVIVDSLNVYNKFNELQIKCESCGSFDHQTFKCGLITYCPINKKIIDIYQEMNKQKRKRFTRKRSKRFHNLKDQFYIETSAAKFNKFDKKTVDNFYEKYLNTDNNENSDSDSLSDSNNNNTPKSPPVPSVKVIAPQNPHSHRNSEDSKENTPKNNEKKDISYPAKTQPSFFIQLELEKQDSQEKISMRPKKDSLTGSNTPTRKKAISGGSGKFEEHLKRKDTFDDVGNDKINEKLKTDKNLLTNNLNTDSNNQNEFNPLFRRFSNALMKSSKYSPSHIFTEENLLNEDVVDIKQEFERAKNYKYYFSYNNCDVIILEINKKSNMKTSVNRNSVGKSPRKRKKRDEIKHETQVKPKEKSFLSNFLRKQNKNPSFSSLFQKMVSGDKTNI